MKKRRPWLRWILMAILLVVGLVLIFNQPIKEHLVASYQPKVSKQSIAQNNKKKATYNFSDVKDLNLQSAAQARANRQQIHVIGEVSVPDINMTIPIAKGVNNTTLALAAGTMRPGMKMGQGNYALAGHNMAHGSKILFSPLYYHAKVGQMVYLTDLKRVYEYKIYKRTFIAATQVNVVNDTKQPIITMITCDATGARRLLIRGRFVKSEPFNSAPQKAQKAFSSKYTNGR